jgi:hypothetical protein
MAKEACSLPYTAWKWGRDLWEPSPKYILIWIPLNLEMVGTNPQGA